MTAEDRKINLLIADDHPVFRVGLLNILKTLPFISEIYEASNGVEAINACIKHPIDIVLMDIDMPEMNGVEASRKIKVAYPQVDIVVLTMFNQSKHVLDLYDCGVSGYLLKDATLAEISKALNLVKNGEHYYCKAISAVLIKGLMNRDQVLENIPEHAAEPITDREIEILRLVCDQHSSIEIGELLSLSEHTVKRHRQSLMEKTQSKNLAGLVLFAVKNNIISINN